jgi:hypothetical protein
MVHSSIFVRMQEKGSPLQLGIFRALVGLQVFYASSSKAFEYWQGIGEQMNTKTWLPAFLEDLIAEHLVGSLQLTVQISALMITVGLLTRFALPVCTAAFLLLYAYSYRCFDAPIQWLYLWFPLLILCFSRCADAFSLDRVWLRRRQRCSLDHAETYYQWPLEMVIGWFVYIYLAAGIAKIIPLSIFIPWIEGGTSKNIMYARFLDSPLYFIFGAPLFNYADHYWLYVVMSFGSVLVELSVVLLLFSRAFYLPVLVSVIGMHWFLYFVGVAGFAQTALVLVFAFLPAYWFKGGFAKTAGA